MSTNEFICALHARSAVKKYASPALLQVMVVLLLGSYSLKAQDMSVSGQVLNAKNQIMSYANLLLFDASDSSFVKGTISAEDGTFVLEKLRKNAYYLHISSLGYKDQTLSNIDLSTHSLKLPDIILEEGDILLNEVELSATRSPLQFQIDRKVVNVADLNPAPGNTAIDLMENLPSVIVDGNGDMLLRGSAQFTVFINGRPSVYSGSEALRLIPAGSIERIELITNPSVKYDPDGTSGIVNIVTKQGMDGYSGQLRLTGGNLRTLGGELISQFNKGKFDFFLSANYTTRDRISDNSSIERFELDNNRYSEVRGQGTNISRRSFYNVRTGMIYQSTPKNRFSLFLEGGENDNPNDFQSTFTTFYSETGQSSTVSNLIDGGRWGSNLSADLGWEHLFDKEKHKLSAAIFIGRRTSAEDNGNRSYDLDSDQLTDQTRSTEDDISRYVRFNVDYSLPVNSTSQFETGYQARIHRMNSGNGLFLRDVDSGEWISAPQYSFRNTFKRDIHSIYMLFKGNSGKWGYQAGIRGEYTSRLTEYIDSTASFGIERMDWFPSVHSSYAINDRHQILLSYSRRINRPRSWWLENNITFVSPFSVRTGNPDLQPEYIDALEWAYQGEPGQWQYSIELYYRNIRRRVQRIRSVFDADQQISITQPINIGKEDNLGSTFSIKHPLGKGFTPGLMGNLYYYHIQGKHEEQNFDREDFTYNLSLNLDYSFWKTARLQLLAQYFDAIETAQGGQDDYFNLNLSGSKSFWKDQLQLNFRVNNLLESVEYNRFSSGPGFSSENVRRARRNFIISAVWTINEYRNGKKKEQDDDY